MTAGGGQPAWGCLSSFLGSRLEGQPCPPAGTHCSVTHPQPTDYVSEAPRNRCCGWRREAGSPNANKVTTLVTFPLGLRALFDPKSDKRVGGTLWEEGGSFEAPLG